MGRPQQSKLAQVAYGHAQHVVPKISHILRRRRAGLGRILPPAPRPPHQGQSALVAHRPHVPVTVADGDRDRSLKGEARQKVATTEGCQLEGVPGEGESCPARSQRGRQHHGGGLGDGPGGEGKGSSQSLGVGEDEAAASRRNIGGDGGGKDGEVLPGGIGGQGDGAGRRVEGVACEGGDDSVGAGRQVGDGVCTGGSG